MMQSKNERKLIIYMKTSPAGAKICVFVVGWRAFLGGATLDPNIYNVLFLGH